MQKNSKFLLVAIPLAVVLFCLTVYEYGYRQVESDIAATREATFNQKKVLKKYLTVIAGRPDLEKRFAALQEIRKGQDAKIFQAQTPSVAAAALQETVKNIIAAKGGTVSSERIEKSEDSGIFKIITVAVDAEVRDIRALSETIYALEMQAPYLVVRELDATIRNYTDPRELQIRLRLSGLTGGK